MRSIRTFIAVELSSTVIARAQEGIKLLKTSGAEVGWVDRAQMHLTLKFLGNVTDIETPDICRVVVVAARQVEPFEIVFRGLGAFPRVTEPRTIWMGIEQGQEELAELHAAIEDALKKEMGFGKENRKFHPHLTLGRLRKESDPARDELSRILQGNANFDGDLTVVDEVVVFASTLGRQGPTHEAMGHASLAE
ncbi:MAG: RNA 2',3'-cyclic phosphodiesterase [Planctomycetales bacterium]|nr:RNA 2',3'-cyclic phosphodiesterase [Planctomycetales bacterium]